MYSYEIEKKKLLTDEGQKLFINVRDDVLNKMKSTGAIRLGEAISGFTGCSWKLIECIDRMVELGDIVELSRNCWGQYRVFTFPEIHNR